MSYRDGTPRGGQVGHRIRTVNASRISLIHPRGLFGRASIQDIACGAPPLRL